VFGTDRRTSCIPARVSAAGLCALLLVMLAACAGAGNVGEPPEPAGVEAPATTVAQLPATTVVEVPAATAPAAEPPAPAPTRQRPEEERLIEPEAGAPARVGATPPDPPDAGPPGGAASNPPPTTAPEARPSTSPSEADLRSFLQSCENGIQDWRHGQVDYPERLTLGLGDVTSYVAAVDIRATPMLPSEVIPGPSAESDPVAVKCAVAARLVPVGGALEVNPSQDSWERRTFTPSGVINWAWTVKAVKAGAQDLRLELQPAVISEGGGDIVLSSGSNVGSFITNVEIDAPFIDDAKQWIEKTWGLIVTIAASLAAAILAIITWGGDLGQKLREFRAKWRGAPVLEGRPPDQDQ
jgi:hypothetical protein